MTNEELEGRLRAWYRSEIPGEDTAPTALRVSLAAIPRGSAVPRRLFGPRRGVTMFAAAALLTTAIVGGALLAGSGIDRTPSVLPPPDATSTKPSPEPSDRPSSTPGPESPLGGGWIIAYDPEDQAGAVGVHLVDAGTGQRTLLGTLPSSRLGEPDWVFQWASDRTRVLISRGISHQTTRVPDSLTEAGRRLNFLCCLPPNDGWGPPVLSPQGDKIAVGGGVYFGDPDDGTFTKLSVPAGAAAEGLLSWSPDEVAIVTGGCDPCGPSGTGRGRLFLQPVDGSPVRELLDIPSLDETYGGGPWAPAWSPDGTKVAFGRTQCVLEGTPPRCVPPTWSIATVPASGGNLTELWSGPEEPGIPLWSPDGRRIALRLAAGILVMDPDGSNRIQLDTGPMELIAPNLPGPKWSPDSTWLMYMQDGNLWVVPAEGGAERQLGSYRGADW